MEEDLKNENILDESNKEGDEKSKDEQAASFTRRQILHMGWSVPIAFGLAAIFPKMADAGSIVDWSDHSDKHGDHNDHDDYSERSAGSTKIYPFKQSLLQDVAKINEEIKMLQTKLNKAREGENLDILNVTLSAKNLKAFFNSLSAKINDAQKNQRSIGNIQKLSEGASKGIIVINSLEQKAGANMKSDSLKLSNELSKLMIGLQSEINKL